jgi:hypothetical protein
VSGLRELQAIAAAGGQVISAGENVDVATPTGMFSTTIFLAAAQLRRDKASKAWKATHQSRHERGLPHGKVPLGYVAAGGQVTVDPVLGPAMTVAFEDYAAGRASQLTIAQSLTQLRGGCLPGKGWYRASCAPRSSPACWPTTATRRSGGTRHWSASRRSNGPGSAG